MNPEKQLKLVIDENKPVVCGTDLGTEQQSIAADSSATEPSKCIADGTNDTNAEHADRDSATSKVGAEELAEKVESEQDSIDELAALEMHKAAMRRRRNIRRIAMVLCVLAILASVVLIQELRTVPDKDLGLTALPPRQVNYGLTSVPTVPEWQKQWEIYYDDKPWKDIIDTIVRVENIKENQAQLLGDTQQVMAMNKAFGDPWNHATPEQRRQHRLNEEKALAIATEVANRHDSQYIPAVLRQAQSLEETGYIIAWEKGDRKLAEASKLQAYEIEKRILGESHINTLWSLENLGHFYEVIRRNDEARRIYKLGLKLSEEAFGKTDAEGMTLMFVSDLRHCADPITHDYPERSQLAKDYDNIHSDPNDNITYEEGGAGGSLFFGRLAEADETYHKLLKAIAKKEGLNSKRLWHVADCYCCALEAQGRVAEAQKIRTHLNVQRR